MAYCKAQGFPAQMVKNMPAMRETWVQSLGCEDPLEEGMATHSSIPAWGISMDRGAWGDNNLFRIPWWLDRKFACNAGDLGSIPGLGRSPEGGHGDPLQYSCLENPHGQR